MPTSPCREAAQSARGLWICTWQVCGQWGLMSRSSTVTSAPDPVGCAAHRKLAQGREIAGREIVAQRPLGLVGRIDLARFQPFNQFVGRQVDQ